MKGFDLYVVIGNYCLALLALGAMLASDNEFYWIGVMLIVIMNLITLFHIRREGK